MKWIEDFVNLMNKKSGGKLNDLDKKSLRNRAKHYKREDFLKAYEKWVETETHITQYNIVSTFLQYIPKKTKVIDILKPESEILTNPETATVTKIAFTVLREMMKFKIPACMKQKYLKPCNPVKKPSKKLILLQLEKGRTHEKLLNITEDESLTTEALRAISSAFDINELKEILTTAKGMI